MGARAVPAGGLANRSRAASGISLPALRTGPRGARWTGTGSRAGNARTNCVRFCPRKGDVTDRRSATSQETGLKLHLEMEYSLGQSCGGTPIDVRLLLEARPCQQHGTRINASVGVPLPFLYGLAKRA